MLVHICCSVDSHFFLERLKKEFKDEEIVGFFYDPNIHPYSEYQLRLLDVKRSCERLGIPLIEGEYDYKSWLRAVRGLENEPEKGERCMVCFDHRLKRAALKAKELGHKRYTTTLLVSPLKSQEQLKKSGAEVDRELGTEFVFLDYRSGGGTQEQARVSKEQKLYRQDYCGCLFGLTQQRAKQEVIMDEMLCPITKQILPASIEERLELYKKRMEWEERGISYEIFRRRFLNYRLLMGWVRVEKEVVPSYIVSYSLLRRKRAKARVDFIENGVGFYNRDEVKVIALERFNQLLNENFYSTKELTFKGIAFSQEVALREKLLGPYDLSPLVVLDKIPSKLELFIDAVTYKDIKEELKRIENA